MSEEDRNIMKRYDAYWSTYVNNRIAIILGSVMDTKGAYGIAVIAV
ncbi:MAG: hypothetical protein ABI172_01075 [Ginsengibacter sp.]